MATNTNGETRVINPDVKKQTLKPKKKEDLHPGTSERKKAKEVVKKKAGPQINKSKAEMRMSLKQVEGEEQTEKKFKKENPHFEKYQKLKMPDGSEVRDDKLQKMDTSEFLKMDTKTKLSLVTKGEKIVKPEELKKDSKLTIDFPDNGKMVANIGVEDLFDKNISVISIDGKDYKRDSLTGAFKEVIGKDKDGKDILGARGVILDGSKIEIKGTRENDQIKKMEDGLKKKSAEIVKSLKIDKSDKKQMALLGESLEKGLNEKEIGMIMKGDFDGLSKISPKSRQKEIMKNLIHLRDKGLLQNQKLIDQVNNFDDDRSEKLETQLKSKKGEIPEGTKGYHKNKNGSMVSDNPNMNGGTNQSSYGGRTYNDSMSVGENVNTSDIDAGYKNLQEVKNPEGSKEELVKKGVSEKNAEIIAKRIPKEWFDVAISFAKKEGTIKENKPIALASVGKRTGMISYPDGKFEQFPIITADKRKGKTDMLGAVSHFDGGKIAGKGNDASKGGSHTVLGAAAYSPEGGSHGGKWWHGVKDSRIPGGHTFGCVGIKQEISMRLVRSIQQSGGGYGYEVA